ncbi:MAG TPA: sulfotransferase [Steroidobacteraceae bacterium]|nr:sulfotransferase [Steroidobacteraceae bacterium]
MRDAEAHYVLGQRHADAGRFEEAAATLKRATLLRPEFADAHNDLGRVLLKLGQTEAAIAACERALALRPQFTAAIGNLADAKRIQGDLDAAIEGYLRVIALDPGLTEAVTQLARALLAAGRGAEAVPYYQRLLARGPHPETLNELGSLLVGLARYDEAARCFREALALAPADARLHANLGHALHCLGDFRASIEHSRRAAQLDPRLAQAHLHLGNSLLAMNALYEADAAYRAGLDVAPEHAALHAAQAMAARALGRLAEAETSAQRALALRPGAADTLALLGSLAIDRGRFEAAEELLRQAIAIDPQSPEALTSLAVVRKMTLADAPWQEAAERALARGLPVAHASNLHHALGKYHEDVGNPDAAFEHHRRGNELARRSRPLYDRAEMTRGVSATLASFDRASLAALRSDERDSSRAVFVVGMPRSGTSLTEQILASHPQVHGAGELLYWIYAADVERAAVAERRAATIAQLGRDYLSGLAALAPQPMRVIDKLPVNFRRLGLIHAALPQARFIHLERNALDTCLSIYFQGFSAAHPYATDLGDIAHYYHEYRRLMSHWRAVLPAETLLEVRYEDLVEDPEGWSRRMLAHLGLPWDARCLEFHRTDRPVLTASNWQVRQPIGKGSIGRWRRYERFLGELREALGPAIS